MLSLSLTDTRLKAVEVAFSRFRFAVGVYVVAIDCGPGRCSGNSPAKQSAASIEGSRNSWRGGKFCDEESFQRIGKAVTLGGLDILSRMERVKFQPA